MSASLVGPRVARSLVPVQAAAANTTHARPTTACGGMAHALPVASVVSLQTLGTSSASHSPFPCFGGRPGPRRRVFDPGGRPDPRRLRRLLRPSLAFFFGVALPNNPWIARWTCSRTSFWTTLMKLVGRGIRDPPFEFGAVFHNFQTPVQRRGMTEDCDKVGESRFV